MMKEAQKMMADPAFQAHCQKLMAGPQFQQAMTQLKGDLTDPAKVKALEEKTKTAIQKGQAELEQLQKEVEEAATSKSPSATTSSSLVKKVDEGSDDKKKAEEQEDDDAKASAKVETDNDAIPEIPDMPDIPSLNIN
jgi:hypothetical protein